jgi:hypothetical protein
MAAPKGNKFALGCTTNGRPPIYDDPEKYAAKIRDYYNYCEDNEEKVTITGLALYLGFESRQSFYDYAGKVDFMYITKRAQLAVEHSYETHGQTIDIFALKNMGWKDEQHIDHTNNGKDFNNLSDAELIARINKLISSGTKSGTE